MKSEPWWVCNVCGAKIARVGDKAKAKPLREMMIEHRRVCGATAGFYIKQVLQGGKR